MLTKYSWKSSYAIVKEVLDSRHSLYMENRHLSKWYLTENNFKVMRCLFWFMIFAYGQNSHWKRLSCHQNQIWD